MSLGNVLNSSAFESKGRGPKMEQKEETTRSARLILFDISEVIAQECDFVCERGVALEEIANSSIGIDYGGVVSVPEMLSNEREGRLRESAAQIDCNVSWVHEAEIAMMREEFVDGDVVVGCAQFLDIEDGGREGV